MAEPEQGGAAAFIRDAPFRVVLEIVRRLPTRSAIRIRAVCKPWRDVTAHPALLAVLHRLQPPQPLLCFGRAACPNRYIPLRDYCVEALNLRSDKLSSIFRFTDYSYLNYDRFVGGDQVAPIDDFAVDYHDYDECHDAECFMPRLTVHASLDGLLVVSFLHAWYVCNPATRQWAPLPDLSYCDVVGFYEHISSGEYRVMYQIGKDDEHVSTYYYVLTVGTRLSRIIGCPISPEAAEDMGLDIGLDPAKFSPPVQLRRNLHWPPQERQGYHILVFNTESELFHWMSPPVRDKDMRLLEIEGKLALSVSRMNKATLELWRLEDYQNEIWVQMFRIQLAVAQMTELHREDWSPAVVSPEGDVLIECPYRVLHCDRNGNLLQKFLFPDEAASARHALRESLLQHAIFLAPKWHNVSEPPFYMGL
ncbi:hypothetical protein QOZ80_3AG0245010 [Eleusine coracana subsp. coracana]|nr:hypothetical protein QOZ80_3AG0245010 [Eleusine coracana subsp. coracana]